MIRQPMMQSSRLHPVSASSTRVRFLEPEHEMERTYKVKQKDLVKKVDVGSATKVSG